VTRLELRGNSHPVPQHSHRSPQSLRGAPRRSNLNASWKAKIATPSQNLGLAMTKKKVSAISKGRHYNDLCGLYISVTCSLAVQDSGIILFLTSSIFIHVATSSLRREIYHGDNLAPRYTHYSFRLPWAGGRRSYTRNPTERGSSRSACEDGKRTPRMQLWTRSIELRFA
jgi:hypothetical protein